MLLNNPANDQSSGKDSNKTNQITLNRLILPAPVIRWRWDVGHLSNGETINQMMIYRGFKGGYHNENNNVGWRSNAVVKKVCYTETTSYIDYKDM